MNPFYYLYLPMLALPLILVFFHRVVFKSSFKQEWLVLANIVITYLFILAGSMVVEYFYQAKLATFDLNRDGVFSGAELTAEQQVAQDKAGGMSARTLAPAIGAMFAFFYSALFYCVLIACDAVRKKREQKS